MMLRDRLQSKFNKNRIQLIQDIADSDKFYAAVNATGIDVEDKQSNITIKESTYKNFQYVYDVNFGETNFLKKAGDYGAKTKDGFDMLFYQSVGSLEIWIGKGALDVSVISKVYDNVKTNLYTSITV
jgi:shikimate 5-dehydrogenase